MNILLLDGLRSKDHTFHQIIQRIIENIKKSNFDYEHVQLRSISLKNCRGCFACWTKKPGLCVINDDLNKISKKYIQCDVAFAISPIVFGGYSCEYKKFLDRCIPCVLPYFRTIFGETHHKLRYPSYPKHVYIGFQSEENKHEQTIFKSLVHRNRLNLHDKEQLLVLFTSTADDETIDTWCLDIFNKLKKEISDAN